MSLHDSLIEAAMADFEAAKILSSTNCFPQSLFYLQQAYEKILKSFYVALRVDHDKIDEQKVNAELKDRFVHKNMEITSQLLDILFPVLHKLRKVPDPKEQDENSETLLKLRKTRVLEDVLMKDYSRNIKQIHDDYANMANASHSIYTRFVLLTTILSVCLYGIESTSRYPLEKYNYSNIKDLLRVENAIACGCIIQLITELLQYYDAMDKLFATGSASS